MRKVKRRLNVLVTAGPTREPIDPVRFISNYSTGLFGYEIAKEASARGHRVVLISGPTSLAKPKGIRLIDVVTARQMKEKLKNKFGWCDCLIMTAAVGDFRPKTVAKKKIKTYPPRFIRGRRACPPSRFRGRRGGKRGEITLELRQNPDILDSLGRRKGKKTLVGFALETENLKKNAQSKLRAKNLDLIVATQMKSNSYPFGQVRLDALIMDRKGHIQQVKGAQKTRLSGILLDSIEKTVLS